MHLKFLSLCAAIVAFAVLPLGGVLGGLFRLARAAFPWPDTAPALRVLTPEAPAVLDRSAFKAYGARRVARDPGKRGPWLALGGLSPAA